MKKKGESGDKVIFEPHKKFRQKVDLLLNNPNFKEDVVRIRGQFSDFYKTNSALTQEFIRISKLSLPDDDFKKILQAQYRKMSEYSAILSKDNSVRREISGVVKKYELKPKNIWFLELRHFLFNDYFIPRLSSMDSSISIQEMHAIDVDQGLTKQNFQIWLDPERGLCVQIFDDTALADIRSGWKYIEKAKKVFYKKTRFYPLKNIDLAASIFKLDKAAAKSDWEKQNEIFGDTESFKEEDKGIKKIKQVRHRYGKRFGLKS